MLLIKTTKKYSVSYDSNLQTIVVKNLKAGQETTLSSSYSNVERLTIDTKTYYTCDSSSIVKTNYFGVKILGRNSENKRALMTYYLDKDTLELSETYERAFKK